MIRGRRRLLLLAALGASACDEGRVDFERMLTQNKLEPYEPSPHFSDGVGMRQPPEGTVHRGAITGNEPLRDGTQDGVYVTEFPLPIDRDTLARGENRFLVFCAPCHGVLGDGRSQVAENMQLRPPPSLHEQRLRDYPVGRIYSVIRQGYGLMPSYAADLSVEDRWAVVAYVQALQLSQNLRLAELPPDLAEGARPWLK